MELLDLLTEISRYMSRSDLSYDDSIEQLIDTMTEEVMEED